jgi:ArsR family transcriptional regulator
MNDIFKVLNDTTRREIVELLKTKNMFAVEIADQFNMSKPSISHHLDILKRADLITAEKSGQFISIPLTRPLWKMCCNGF